MKLRALYYLICDALAWLREYLQATLDRIGADIAAAERDSKEELRRGKH